MSENILNVAVVLVTFNRSQLLLNMLNSLAKQTVLPVELFVIDNNSTDDTSDVVRDFKFHNQHLFNITYFNTRENLGGAGGFNVGSRMAFNSGYELIWLIDDDVELDSACLEYLVKYEKFSDILQPMRVNMDGSCAETSGLDYELNSVFRLNPKKRTVIDVADEKWDTLKLKTIPFEGPLIHRRVFEKIGFPDPRFFIFYDDLDFSLRASNAGFEILCIKQSIIKRKIPFIRAFALSGWKGYFMYRNFFYVQLVNGAKYIAYTRVSIIFLLVLMHSLFTNRISSLRILIDAFVHAVKGDFTANSKYRP
jgi:rhamnopyranosyl-N-acetylglucosaminyl-diphospho-decaprenol beta-1,3/1,4-galactofuranosyltransferase